MGPNDAEGIQDLGSAEQVIEEFFAEQLERHRRERSRLEQMGVQGPQSRWNRQELYLDEAQRLRASEASRRHLARHLARHPELRAPRKRVALREVVALQHYIAVDLEDISLPEGRRRSDDIFSGASGDVCEQLLLDAARSVFVVEDQNFDFSKELRAHSLELQRDTAEVEQLRQGLADRLVAAVVQCLGGDPPPRLLRAVTTAMSQSGLANVERACNSLQLAVSGGDQSLLYELRAVSDGAWDLGLSVRKSGFEQCILYSAEADRGGPRSSPAEPMPVACRRSSFVAKSCRVRFCLGGDGSVNGDVLELHREACIRDRLGRSLVGPGDGDRRFICMGCFGWLRRCSACICGRKSRRQVAVAPAGKSKSD